MSGAESTLGGRYVLKETIGRGGMGTVYRADDTVLRRTVAVKLLSAAGEEERGAASRFEREARIAASLSHPSIVAVYDSGSDGETRYIVMEHVRGESLSSILRERGALAIEEVVRIGERIADALAAIHAASLVHRDLKPSNVMLAADGEVKLLDFGVAYSPAATALTQTATVLGSASYMAPEQAAGKRGDARSDIYSLGCMLYALLAGAPPFEGDNAAAVLHQHVHAAPEKVASLRGGVPPGLDALLASMLRKPPSARPQSAGEVRDRLARMAGRAAPRAAGTAIRPARFGAAAVGAPRSAATTIRALRSAATTIRAPRSGAATIRAPRAAGTAIRAPRHARRRSVPTPIAAIAAVAVVAAALGLLLSVGGTGHGASSARSGHLRSSSSSSAGRHRGKASATAAHSATESDAGAGSSNGMAAAGPQPAAGGPGSAKPAATGEPGGRGSETPASETATPPAPPPRGRAAGPGSGGPGPGGPGTGGKEPPGWSHGKGHSGKRSAPGGGDDGPRGGGKAHGWGWEHKH